MKDTYLEVTFRHGRPMAAYYYLPRQSQDKSCRTKRIEPGLVIDFNQDGKPIGIEMTAPSKISLAIINQVLADLGLPSVKQADLAPLTAA